MKKMRLASLALTICVILTLVAPVSACAEHVTESTRTILVQGKAIRGTYTGNVENGFPHGFGVFFSSNSEGDFLYAGEWENGDMTGHGRMVYYQYTEKMSGRFEGSYLMEGTYYFENVTISIKREADGAHIELRAVEMGDIFKGIANDELTSFSGVFYDWRGNEYVKCVDMSVEVFEEMLYTIAEKNITDEALESK